MCWPFVRDRILERRSKLLTELLNRRTSISAYFHVSTVLLPTSDENIRSGRIPCGIENIELVEKLLEDHPSLKSGE